MSNNNHKADQANKNKDTSGTNAAYQKVLDNRSKQLNVKDPRSQKKQ